MQELENMNRSPSHRMDLKHSLLASAGGSSSFCRFTIVGDKKREAQGKH